MEWLKDGASALYGTDATAGVITFVLRRDYRGIEATAYYGAAAPSGEPRLTQVAEPARSSGLVSHAAACPRPMLPGEAQPKRCVAMPGARSPADLASRHAACGLRCCAQHQTPTVSRNATRSRK